MEFPWPEAELISSVAEHGETNIALLGGGGGGGGVVVTERSQWRGAAEFQ